MTLSVTLILVGKGIEKDFGKKQRDFSCFITRLTPTDESIPRHTVYVSSYLRSIRNLQKKKKKLGQGRYLKSRRVIYPYNKKINSSNLHLLSLIWFYLGYPTGHRRCGGHSSTIPLWRRVLVSLRGRFTSRDNPYSSLWDGFTSGDNPIFFISSMDNGA